MKNHTHLYLLFALCIAMLFLMPQAQGAPDKKAPSKGSASQNDKPWIPYVLADRTFAIEIDQVFLTQGVRRLSVPVPFFVRRGRVQTSLPYIGRFSSPNLAVAQNLTLDLDGPLAEYSVDTLRRGAYRVKFKMYQIGESFNIEIKVTRDAYATLYVQSSMRSEITYSGMLKIVEGWRPGAPSGTQDEPDEPQDEQDDTSGQDNSAE